MAFVAIIIEESKHKSAGVPNTWPVWCFNWKENISFITTVACDSINSEGTLW